jgi:hypothetical protein
MTNAIEVFWSAMKARSSFTSCPAGTSARVTTGKPAAFTRSRAARRFGTPNPTWFTLLPLLPPVGVPARRSTMTLVNFTAWFVPSVAGVPPSASTQNFRWASTLVTIRWWWP